MRTIVFLAVLLVCFSGCGVTGALPDVRPSQPNVASLAPLNWYIFYSASMPDHPTADTEGAWSFDFPTGGHVNYIETPFNATTTLHSVNVAFKIESSAPEYQVLDPSDILPATIHVFLEQQNDDLVDPNGRWWAEASNYNLGSQDGATITFELPLTPDLWSNVYGQHSANAFSAALQNIGWVGLTCGGQYFWGHGVALSGGSAKFILINFTVQ